jgi:four helix bundle protein
MKNKQAYKDLAVWNNSLELVKDTYILTSIFPEDEQGEISKALKNYAISIPGSIAKAMQEEEVKLRKKYFEQSHNAITEIETLLIIAQKLEYIEEKDMDNFTDKSNKISMQIKELIQKFSN